MQSERQCPQLAHLAFEPLMPGHLFALINDGLHPDIFEGVVLLPFLKSKRVELAIDILEGCDRL